MLKLYTKTACAECLAVKHKFEEYGIAFEELNIGESGNYEELVKIGGADAPHLVDMTCGAVFAGQSAIMEHLEKHKVGL